LWDKICTFIYLLPHTECQLIPSSEDISLTQRAHDFQSYFSRDVTKPAKIRSDWMQISCKIRRMQIYRATKISTSYYSYLLQFNLVT